MPTCYQKTLILTEHRSANPRVSRADRRARNFERKEWLQPTTMDPDDEHWAQRAHEGADNVPRMEPPPPPPQGPLCISSASVKAVFDGVPSDPMTRFSTLWRWRQARSNRQRRAHRHSQARPSRQPPRWRHLAGPDANPALTRGALH